jgi:hypothetical protein
MKRFGWIGIMVLLVLAACTHSAKVVEPVETPSPELSAIDSLMWCQPDSALAELLNYWNNDSRDVARYVSTNETFDNHYANLLLSELLYKNDYAQTNRPALQQAVAYFDSLCSSDAARHVATNDNLAFLDARAHYINGVGYYENDSVVEACKEYMRALEVMESRFEEKDLAGNKAQFIAMTYIRLTVLFSDLYLHEQTIYFAQYSLFYYRKQKPSSWHLSWIMNEIATHYDIMEELDSANYYYQEASAVLNDTNIILFRDIAAHQAFLQYRQDNNQTEATLLQLQHLLSRSENKEECDARSLVIGEIFYCEKQFDSAWHYLDKVYRQTSNVGAKKQAAERLVNICKTVDKNISIVEYANFLIPFANQEENNSGLKSQLIELYNTIRQKKMEQENNKETRKHAKHVVFIFIGMIAVLLIVISFYHRNKRSKQKLEAQMQAERQAHKIQQAALAGRLRQSNAALKAQEKMKPAMALVQEQNTAENYAEESICQHILSVCNDKSNPIKSTVPLSAYTDIALSDIQKAKLRNAALRHFGLMFEKLRRQYPNLKEKDFLYCYLCLLGLDNVQISVLLQNSISTIWERENRLKKIFGSDNKIAIILFGFMND